nr:glycerol-3-phosphate 1-O-acyltransferase PlsY [uncultured Peptoniphilus sp.]
MKTALLLFLCYLIGTISGAYIIGMLFKHTDIRKEGSGNAGTTNAIRVMGKKLGYMTFAVDVLKGVAVMLIVAPMLDQSYRLFATLFVVLGHDYPFYLGFRGGKGIATTFGAFGAVAPLYVAIAALGGFIVGKVSRYVSLGSLTFLSIASVLMIFSWKESSLNVLAIVLIWALGFLRHRSNIKRLKEGTENKVGG